jgi:hypothetical protein
MREVLSSLVSHKKTYFGEADPWSCVISGILLPGEEALVILGHELTATVFPF